jgi:hypothetical protein
MSGVLFYQYLLLDKQKHHFYGVNPRFSMNWTISSRLKTGASFSYSKNLPDENLFYYGNIMNSYRSLTAGCIDFSTGKSANVSTSMEYKDVIKTLFADLRFSLSKRYQTKITGQDFVDDYILNYYYSGKQTTEILSVSGSLSKGIEVINGIVAFYPAFIRAKSGISRNGTIIPFSSDSYLIRGKLNSRFSKKSNLTYEISYNHSINRMETNRQYFSSNRLSESLKLTCSPIKILQMGYSLEHYCNQLTENNYKHFFFSDVSASYLPCERWEFTCSIKNIFNEKHYSYFIENELTSFYRSYSIRPRNVLLSATYRF